MPNYGAVIKGIGGLADIASKGTSVAKNVAEIRNMRPMVQPVVAGLKNMAIHAGALGLMTGGMAAVGAAVDHVKLNSSYQKMLQLYPELQRENPERVKLYFDSIANSSPSVAQQPLVAGSLIKRLINYDGFDHTVHKDLVSAQSQLDRNRMSANQNLLNLADIGLSQTHRYRFGGK